MKSEGIKSEIKLLEEKSLEISKAIIEQKKLLYAALADEAGLTKGDKVNLYKHGNKIGTGFFVGYMEKWGRIRCVVAKGKKDGTPSLNDWDDYDFDRIEKAAQ